jgi:hypothetical protein
MAGQHVAAAAINQVRQSTIESQAGASDSGEVSGIPRHNRQAAVARKHTVVRACGTHLDCGTVEPILDLRVHIL